MSLNTAPLMSNQESSRSWFTLKDVESSVSKFDGSNAAKCSGYVNWMNALIRCSGVNCKSTEIHGRLYKRQQRKGETLQEFLYALMEIANPVDLEDESLIEYFVEGIPDVPSNEPLLYQAKTRS